jgi:hypothetical protein
MYTRFAEAERFAAESMKKGITIYSPIVHCHELARKYSLPHDYDFWQLHNHNMLEVAQELWILRLPGWDISKGVDGELRHAQTMDIPTLFVDPFPGTFPRGSL